MMVTTRSLGHGTSYYSTEGRHLTRPVTFTRDGKMKIGKRTRDQTYEAGTEGSLIGGPTGPVIVGRWPRPLTAYSLFEDAGECVLYG
jgi:hypothetical protein